MCGQLPPQSWSIKTNTLTVSVVGAVIRFTGSIPLKVNTIKVKKKRKLIK
jgi:hypothetical protein